MDDLISRQAAIEAVVAEGRTVDSRYLESERIIHESDAVEALSMLPSAQPERKRGHWTSDGHCSVCGEHAPYWVLSTTYHRTPYCYLCGADMRGEEE